METQTKNTTIPKYTAAREAGIDDVKGRLKYQSSPFRPKATLLLDVLPAESVKPLGAVPSESPEELLQELLMTTEASAQRTQFSRRKWQLTSLLLGMLLAATVLVIGWLYVEMNAIGTPRIRQQVENQSLKEQLNVASAQMTGLKDKVDTLLNRNTELVSENAQLKSQGTTPIAAASPGVAKLEQRPAVQQPAEKASPVVRQTIDTSRVEAVKKGTYPSGTTKAELISVLGEPDRVYKSRSYEQLVYFGRKPGRFWFIGNWLVQTTE
jgi:regulator of replication initiation timing